jgi:glycosyltransferase involved in cell wall biosynthesis
VVLKVAFVTNYFSGPELDIVTAAFFKKVVAGLRYLNHEVRVFTLNATDDDFTDSVNPDLNNYSALADLGCVPVLSWSVPRALELKAKLKDEVKAFAPEVILCVKAIDALMWVEEGAPPVALLSVTPQFEIMRLNFDGRFTEVDRALVSALEVVGFRSMSAISAPSDELRKAISSIANLDPETISVYRPLVEVSAPTETDVSSAPRIVYAGTLERYKGVDVLMRAVPLVLKRFPKAQFTLAGEAPPLFGEKQPYFDQLWEQMDRDAQKALTIRGPLNSEERNALMASSTVAVFPFRYCGCMYHVIEAMSAGASVVCSDTGALKETLNDGQNCLLVAPEDETALADRIIELIEDDELRQKLSANARKFVEEHCSIENAAGDVESLCLRAVQSNAVRIDPAAPFLIAAIKDVCKQQNVIR